jgi:hypothetical protein
VCCRSFLGAGWACSANRLRLAKIVGPLAVWPVRLSGREPPWHRHTYDTGSAPRRVDICCQTVVKMLSKGRCGARYGGIQHQKPRSIRMRSRASPAWNSTRTACYFTHLQHTQDAGAILRKNVVCEPLQSPLRAPAPMSDSMIEQKTFAFLVDFRTPQAVCRTMRFRGRRGERPVPADSHAPCYAVNSRLRPNGALARDIPNGPMSIGPAPSGMLICISGVAARRGGLSPQLAPPRRCSLACPHAQGITRSRTLLAALCFVSRGALAAAKSAS